MLDNLGHVLGYAHFLKPSFDWKPTPLRHVLRGARLCYQTPTRTAANFTVDALNNQLTRRVYIFELPYYADRRKITNLPVYPLSAKGEARVEFLDKLAKRGRRWQKYMAAEQQVCMYNGFAFSPDNRPHRGENSSSDTDASVGIDAVRIRKVKRIHYTIHWGKVNIRNSSERE